MTTDQIIMALFGTLHIGLTLRIYAIVARLEQSVADNKERTALFKDRLEKLEERVEALKDKFMETLSHAFKT